MLQYSGIAMDTVKEKPESVICKMAAVMKGIPVGAGAVKGTFLEVWK